jgi:hypothetical protein
MIILDEARRVLEKQGYALSLNSQDMLQFEDETLMGFICEAPLKSILEFWSSRQDEFLKSKASLLRRSALKSWNVYSVFLSSDVASDAERSQLVRIEEDFRVTRKIVQTGITTPSDVLRALYAFIPIQNVVSLDTANSIQTLRERLSELPPRALEALLDDQSSEDALLQTFLEAHDPKTN